MNQEEILKIIEYDRIMESNKWMKEIPEIQFKPDWKVRITPPFGGAVVRFRVLKDEAEVSVYLDCYDRLGIFGQPYWEIYPVENDVHRCAMNNIDELIETIEKSIKSQ